MRPVTITSNYRITIPREVRERFDIKPGQKLVFIASGDSLQIIVAKDDQDSLLEEGPETGHKEKNKEKPPKVPDLAQKN